MFKNLTEASYGTLVVNRYTATILGCCAIEQVNILLFIAVCNRQKKGKQVLELLLSYTAKIVTLYY